MAGRPSQSTSMRYVGATVALVAVVGDVGFGWRFGEGDGLVALVIGVVCTVVAVVWTISRNR